MFNNRLTVYVCTIAKNLTVCFTKAFIFSLSNVRKCPGSLQMASSCPEKQMAGRESPHDWSVDLATFCDWWGAQNSLD